MQGRTLLGFVSEGFLGGDGSESVVITDQRSWIIAMRRRSPAHSLT